VGVGLGSDRFGAEFSRTGEQLDDRLRGQMLDEALQVLAAAWSGRPVHHRGAHYTVDGMQFLPSPVQQPGVPVWVAGFPGNARPLRRAAQYDGFFPVNLEHPDQLAGITAAIVGSRRDTASPFDIVIALPPGAVCQGGRHLVADRIRAHSVAGPGARRAPRRPGMMLGPPAGPRACPALATAPLVTLSPDNSKKRDTRNHQPPRAAVYAKGTATIRTQTPKLTIL